MRDRIGLSEFPKYLHLHLYHHICDLLSKDASRRPPARKLASIYMDYRTFWGRHSFESLMLLPAYSVWSELTEADMDRQELLLGLAEVHERNGDHDSVISLLTKLVSVNPQDPDLQRRLEAANDNKQNMSTSFEGWQRLLHHVRLTQYMPTLFRAGGMPNAATDCWEKLVHSDPDSEEFKHGLKTAINERGLNFTIVMTKRLLRKYPQDLFWRDVLKAAFLENGDHEGLIAFWEELSCIVMDEQLLQELADEYEAKGDYDKAITAWRDLLRGYSNIERRLCLAHKISAVGDVNTTIEAWKLIVSQRPDKTSLQALAEAIEKSDDSDIAIPIWEHLSAEHPNNIQLHTRLAIAFEHKKEYDSAISAWLQVMQLRIPISNKSTEIRTEYPRA